MSSMGKVAKIDNRIYDIVSPQQYWENPALYNPKFTAIESQGMVYPVIKRNENRAGVYVNGPVGFLKQPCMEDRHMYEINDTIVDFDNVDTMQDLINKSEELRDMERDVLTNPDNIFIPRINESDTPEMKGLKEATIAKHIDIDKYEPRFGENYQNDKRLYGKNSITMGKFKTIVTNLDMKATLIIEDRSPDVPNPMGRKVIIELTGDDEDE